MRLDDLNLLPTIVSIVLSLLLATISPLVAGIIIGTMIGVLIAPKVGHASARLAAYLGRPVTERTGGGPAATFTRPDDQS